MWPLNWMWKSLIPSPTSPPTTTGCFCFTVESVYHSPSVSFSSRACFSVFFKINFYCSCFRVIWWWSPISGVTWFPEQRVFFFFCILGTIAALKMFTCPRNISVRSGDRRIYMSSFIIFSARCQVGYNFKNPGGVWLLWCRNGIQQVGRIWKKKGGRATEGLNIQLTILILLKLFKEKQKIFCRQFEGE